MVLPEQENRVFSCFSLRKRRVLKMPGEALSLPYRLFFWFEFLGAFIPTVNRFVVPLLKIRPPQFFLPRNDNYRDIPPRCFFCCRDT